MNKKKICMLTGAAVAFCGVLWLIDAAACSKKEKKAACVGKLLCGIGSLSLGYGITRLPDELAKRALSKQELLKEEDEALIEESIREELAPTQDVN